MTAAPRSTATRDRHRAAIKRERPDCGICNEPIDYDLPHTDPRSFVVDHVIPWTVSHDDSIENKQAAHRDCNRTKWDRVDAGPRTFETHRVW
jgi:5-methylcytosine-specific restriction endonuclease McrA